MHMSMVGYINVALELFGGLLSLVFILCLVVSRNRKHRLEALFIRILYCNTVLLFCDAAAWLFKGRPEVFSSYAVRIANFFVFTVGYILLAVFTDYLLCFISSKGRNVSKVPSYFMWGLAVVAIGLSVVSQFNHMYYIIDAQNIYHRQDWFWLSQLFGIIGMLLNAWLLYHYRYVLERRESLSLAAYILMPAIAMMIQIFVYGIAILHLATSISALSIYISIQVEQARRWSENELELEKSKTIVMLSQIQPHFLYNTLSAVEHLCQTDPPKAGKAVASFSKYLRGNMRALMQDRPIPFTEELSHVAYYLSLEKMRYEERLEIVWEIGVEDFLVPALSVQPIVENAVKHGVTCKQSGGAIVIRTEETAAFWIVSVIDNGVGFDADAVNLHGLEHTGIANVRSRLQAMCSAELELESTLGMGTTARILIPRKYSEQQI